MSQKENVSSQKLCHEGGDLLCIKLLPHTTFKRQAPFSLEDVLYSLTHMYMCLHSIFLNKILRSEIIIMHHIAAFQQHIYSVSSYNKCIVLTRSLHGITNNFSCYYSLIFSLLLHTK